MRIPPEAQFGSHVSTSLVPVPLAVVPPQLVHRIGPMIHDASPDIWSALGRTLNVSPGASKAPGNVVKYTPATLSFALGAPTLMNGPVAVPAAGGAAIPAASSVSATNLAPCTLIIRTGRSIQPAGATADRGLRTVERDPARPAVTGISSFCA